MKDENKNYGSRSVLGAILIIIGGLFLLASLDVLDYDMPRVIFHPSFFLFIIGIMILINTSKKILGVIMALIGGLWISNRIFPSFDLNGGIFLSIAVIGLGLYIILKHRSRPEIQNTCGIPHERNDYTTKKDYIDDVSIFGGGQKVVYSDNFKGGNITAIFGGSEINLTNCRLAEGTNVIDALTIFGGAEIRVPRDWHVIVNATPIFGGFSNKIVKDPAVPVDTSRTLVIKGLAMFGGIEINSKVY